MEERLTLEDYKGVPKELRECLDSQARRCQRRRDGKVDPRFCINDTDLFTLDSVENIQGSCLTLPPRNKEGQGTCFATNDLLKYWMPVKTFDFMDATFKKTWELKNPSTRAPFGCRAISRAATFEKLDASEQQFQSLFRRYDARGRTPLLMALETGRGAVAQLFKAMREYRLFIRDLRSIQRPSHLLSEILSEHFWGPALYDIFKGKRPARQLEMKKEDLPAFFRKIDALDEDGDKFCFLIITQLYLDNFFANDVKSFIEDRMFH